MAKSDAWAATIAEAIPVALSGPAWRLTLDDDQRATATLVDSLVEHQQLETLLTHTPRSAANNPTLHPWLSAPWRQRALPTGSRFAGPHQGGIFCGSLELDTALAEAAHRRLQFWQAMSEPPPSGRLRAEHTAFSFAYHCDKGLRLQSPPFKPHYPVLTDRTSYVATQQLGEQLRNEPLSGFEYPSARCPDFGINIALLTVSALTAAKPGEQQRWLSEVDQQQVLFSNGRRLLRFSKAHMVGND